MRAQIYVSAPLCIRQLVVDYTVDSSKPESGNLEATVGIKFSFGVGEDASTQLTAPACVLCDA